MAYRIQATISIPTQTSRRIQTFKILSNPYPISAPLKLMGLLTILFVYCLSVQSENKNLTVSSYSLILPLTMALSSFQLIPVADAAEIKIQHNSKLELPQFPQSEDNCVPPSSPIKWTKAQQNAIDRTKKALPGRTYLEIPPVNANTPVFIVYAEYHHNIFETANYLKWALEFKKVDSNYIVYTEPDNDKYHQLLKSEGIEVKSWDMSTEKEKIFQLVTNEMPHLCKQLSSILDQIKLKKESLAFQDISKLLTNIESFNDLEKGINSLHAELTKLMEFSQLPTAPQFPFESGQVIQKLANHLKEFFNFAKSPKRNKHLKKVLKKLHTGNKYNFIFVQMGANHAKAIMPSLKEMGRVLIICDSSSSDICLEHNN
jgi:hypothetical protein